MTAGVRPPLVRPMDGRVLGGVAAGLAAHLGFPVRRVRLVLAVGTLLGGAGPLLYVWLWALAPSAGVPPRTASGVLPSGRAGDVALGGVLLLGGLLVLAARLGFGVDLWTALPVVVVIGGAVLAYTQLDEVERLRWATRTGVRTRGAVLRVVAGVLLVMLGVLLLVAQRTDMTEAGRVLTAAFAVLAGGALVLAPWGVRLWRELDAERAARVRDAERADIAAHLHDSVLQTLALIQRSSDDPVQVARLARAQERELRDWLYGSRDLLEAPGFLEAKPGSAPSLAASLRAAVAAVEDAHAVPVDVVVVGDRSLDDRAAALVAALREAVLNAVRHAGAPVQVYVEAGPDGVEAFVRDRGPGFDPAAAPPDRLGVRESIVGRMERAGGSAEVRSSAGQGTEVRLALPESGTQQRGPS